MNIPPALRRVLHVLLSFLIIYFVWSIVVNLLDLGRKVNNDALIPCLLALPPLGFIAIGIVVFKIVESAVFVRIARRIREKFRRKQIK